MLEKIKRNKYQILELTLIFIITLLFNIMCNKSNMDEVLNFGFSYNIASGLIPYKDFNMVITPLYPILNAIIMIFFGKNIITFHIFNAIICTLIFYCIKKKTPKSYYIPYSLLMLYALPNYNLFCMLLLYVLIELEKGKRNDYLIGILLGITFLTKQNIGIYLCLPTLFIKDIKRMFKRGIGFLIPNILLISYLLYNDTLYKFIDYAFLGVSSFAKENQMLDIVSLIIVLTSMIFLVYKYIKTKDIEIPYLFGFLLIVFPIIEPYHTIIAFIPTLTYFIKDLKLNKKIVSLAFSLFIISMFTSNIYNIIKGEYSFPNKTSVFKYRKMIKDEDNMVISISQYINNFTDEVYILSLSAYLVKLESNLKINNYDLLVNGNIGLNGEERVINEIKDNCKNKKCIFLVDLSTLENKKKILNFSIGGINVYNKEIVNFIIDNYQQVDKKGYYVTYTS